MSIEKLFVKKLARKRQVNDLYLFIFFVLNYFAILMIMNCSLKFPSLEQGNLVLAY